MIFYSTSKSFFFHHGRKFFSQTGVPGPANARSPLHYVPFRLAFGNPSIPAPILSPRKPRTCHFAFFCSRRLRPTFAFAGALTGFHLFGYPRQFHHPANRALVFFRSLHSRRLQPTFAFRGCSLRFSPVRVPAQVPLPRKPRTCHFAFFCSCRLLPTFAFGANSSVTKIA